MTTDTIPDTVADDRLEQRLRAACHAVIPHLADESVVASRAADAGADDMAVAPFAPVVPITSGRATGQSAGRPSGRSPLLGAAAAALLVVGGAGVWALASRPEPSGVGVGVGSAPSSVLAPPPVSSPTVSVPCFDAACTPVDRLAVVAGAADLYVGPESLGAPNVDQTLLDQVGLLRCTELTADGTTCQRVEGLAGVAPVSYPTGIVSPDTVPAPLSADTESRIEIGTTFTTVTPEQYVAIWGGSDGVDATTTTVRGHEALRYRSGSRTHLVWQEQPGVLVWVAVPDERADFLESIAEGVRRVSGPATIPHIVVVTPLARAWDANNNNADGLVYAQVGGRIVVGIDYIDSHDSTVTVRQRPGVAGELVVGGMVSAGVMQVRITAAGQTPVTVDTVPFAGAPDNRFFLANVPGGVGEVSVTWLAADGTEVTTPVVAQVVPADVGGDTTVPSTSVLAEEGWPSTTLCYVPGCTGMATTTVPAP